MTDGTSADPKGYRGNEIAKYSSMLQESWMDQLVERQRLELMTRVQTLVQARIFFLFKLAFMTYRRQV